GEAHPMDPAATGLALARLLERPDWGGALLAADAGRPAGYAVWTLGYSLEFGGRDALLDELYVAPEARGRGLGAALVDAAAGTAAAAGAATLHLEAMHGDRVAEFYRRLGFAPRPSTYMTRALGA
ncbi:MAG: GNAT family N-acetyltransferase, partial [Thermodesulfobacteriota bacterium]